MQEFSKIMQDNGFSGGVKMPKINFEPTEIKKMPSEIQIEFPTTPKEPIDIAPTPDWGKFLPDFNLPEDRAQQKLDEVRTELYGPKLKDLSKADKKEVEREITKAIENEEYGKEENIVEDPNVPGVSYQQLGEWVETTVTLYDGLTFDELPESDQLDVLEYEQNVKDIENSTLSAKEKARAIALLSKPDCMENTTTEKRYEKGNVEDKVNTEEAYDVPLDPEILPDVPTPPVNTPGAPEPPVDAPSDDLDAPEHEPTIPEPTIIGENA